MVSAADISIGAHSFNVPNHGFTQISPFNDGPNATPLEKAVQSDHAEVAITRVGIGTILAWNISNFKYHRFFRKDSGLKGSHLATDDLDALVRKMQSQMDIIIDNFLRRHIGVHVIIEGYESFYEELARSLTSQGASFTIVSMLNDKPDGWKSHKNVTALLINTAEFTVLEQGVITEEYENDEGRSEPSTLRVPFAHVRSQSGEKVWVAGVHVSGTGSQHPKRGLRTLASTIHEIWNKDRSSHLVSIGDHNTSPFFGQQYGLGRLYPPVYYTHVNPLCQAAKYDFVTVLSESELRDLYTLAPLTSLSESSKALARSIGTNAVSESTRAIVGS